MRRTLSALAGVLTTTTCVFVACTEHFPDAPLPDAGSDGTTSADAGRDAGPDGPDADASPVPRVPVYARVVSDRVDVQSLLFLAGEMQLGGAPLAADVAGRNLADYDRSYIPTDQYILGNGGPSPVPTTDVFGFSAAVESYEYSKYDVNMVVEESTAGVSLADGPLVAKLPGATSLDRLRARMQDLLTSGGTDLAGYATLPPPSDNPLNYLGFAGQWPSFLPFADWDPAMNPTLAVVQSCALLSGYAGLGAPTIQPLYECVYDSTQLPSRDQQVHKVIVPAVLGLATWKEALGAIDFIEPLHDSCGNRIGGVSPGDLLGVGQPANQVKGTDTGACAGTYIGSDGLEAMWGLTMLAAIDNEAEWLLTSGTTSDGATLGGLSTKLAALQYDYTSPLAWFPASIRVTEDETVVPYPALATVAVADATSRAVDLAALLLGHATAFMTTDPRNVAVGQKVGFQVTYDGDPFAADDGAADGEETLHDRSLAVLRVAFVDLDRMHADPALGIVSDTATVQGGQSTPSGTVTTVTLAHVVLALRQTVLALDGATAQYGVPDPGPAADLGGALNALPLHPPGGAALDGGAAPVFSQRVRQVLLANAAFVRDVLTQPDGTVANSATLAGGHATASTAPTTLESQTAAARALTDGFLLTSDETYRARARAVMARLETAFYGAPSRMYREQAGGADEVHMTPERFAWLQSALRVAYETLDVPGDPALGRPVLEDRIARVNKLYLDGWDDLDGDQAIEPGECLGGRLQMAEQALTGELGRDSLGRPTADRDGDCVTELAHAQKASVQASEVLFTTQAGGAGGDGATE